jgi:sigma-B regulation protein RsbU (phosphoserine phosphatase)
MTDRSTRVLLIEDNPGDADLVRLRLIESKSAVDVSCFDRLSDGLASMSKDPPALVLLDLNLPDSHGAETFRTVLERAPDVPVVILSGQDDKELAIKALHQGVQDYLVKSEITSTHLERSIRYAVERQALLRSLEMSRKQQLEFKNQFLSHVSHELRTPLTCIHQFTTILLDGLAGDINTEQRYHLNTILKSVNQLGAMVRDLLEATRVESRKLRIAPRCVAIDEVIRQAVRMMQATAREKRIGLEMGVDTRVPFVFGDPDRIVQVLINLIDNGIKFTPSDGSVMVKACLADVDPDFVYVSVTDTGRGVNPEAKALIFERLYQDPNAVDNNRKGLGLGLFIAKEIVALHGGKIWVASDPGHGSTFTFTLPLYSLAKLLSPAVVHQGRVREAIVLVTVELTANAMTPRITWRDTCQVCLETLSRCVYLDKDLVLPAVMDAGPRQMFFVVASTDLERANIMMTRIREQLEKAGELKTSGKLSVSARAVPLPGFDSGSVEEQVYEIANRVTEMVRSALGVSFPPAAPKEQVTAS